MRLSVWILETRWDWREKCCEQSSAKKKKKKERNRSGRRPKEINVVILDGVIISCKRTLISETRRTLAMMMPGALYSRTHPSGKFCFISERSATENTVKSSLAPLTSYNDLQTSLLSFFLSYFCSPRRSTFLPLVVSSPHFALLLHLLPRFSLSCPRSSIMPENQRWHTTPSSLKQTSPTVFTRSVFARYFLFSPTLQLGASAFGFVGRGEYRMIKPFGRRNSHGKLCLACTIFQFQIDFKVSVCTILRCEHPARMCLPVNWI